MNGAAAVSLEARGLKSISVLAANRPHGDRLRYMSGCRCTDCRKANARYECDRARARKAGDWNGIVPATKARAHMRKLARAGVGRRAVQAATDIADSILQEIRTGRRQRIRARTERKILAVTTAQKSEHAFTSATRTWALINELLEEGFKRRFILQQLGYKGGGFQFGKERVLVRTAARVERLHRRLTT